MSMKEVEPHSSAEGGETGRRNSIAATEKGRWERLWPVIACGAGLFSDGYLNNVCLSRCATHILYRAPHRHSLTRHF